MAVDGAWLSIYNADAKETDQVYRSSTATSGHLFLSTPAPRRTLAAQGSDRHGCDPLALVHPSQGCRLDGRDLLRTGSSTPSSQQAADPDPSGWS